MGAAPYGLVRIAAPLLFLLAACGPEPEEEKAEKPAPTLPALVLEERGFSDVPGWDDDDHGAAIAALKRSCGRLQHQPDDRPVGKAALAGTVEDWRAPCAALSEISAEAGKAAKAYFERWFRPYLAYDGEDPEGLFTGYYEAEVEAARRRAPGYQVPLYAKPRDLVTVRLGDFRADLEGQSIVGRVEEGRLVPYHTRAEIEAGAAEDTAEVLLWLADPVDAFFLHVQGSGRVELADGSMTRVGYAASNGRPFHAIGRDLIDMAVIPPEKMSMQAIRDWLQAHPEKAREIMQRNARYIFFREITGEGPIGAQGVALTPGRSLAVDPDFVPLGIPVYLDTTFPASARPLRRLMIAQDTGAAIKGPVRGDFFWGSGEAALAEAGRMKQSGRYYLLLPKSVAERRRQTS